MFIVEARFVVDKHITRFNSGLTFLQRNIDLVLGSGSARAVRERTTTNVTSK